MHNKLRRRSVLLGMASAATAVGWLVNRRAAEWQAATLKKPNDLMCGVEPEQGFTLQDVDDSDIRQWQWASSPDMISDSEAPVALADSATNASKNYSKNLTEDLPEGGVTSTATENAVAQRRVASQEDRARHFSRTFNEDIFLPEAEHILLESVLLRLQKAQRLVGHGNFNVLSFDDLLAYSRRYPQVGAFSKAELDFIERIYFTDARRYGFMGERVTERLTQAVSRKDIIKMPHTGHYLFRGDSEAYYHKLTKDVGQNVVLTSGIRGNVKQLYLFLAKARSVSYNLSKASRSLAPPGHSFHGIGDFDVGRVGWGADNFTARFAATDEYKRMQDLGYVQIRYTENNRLGVRFEPWHIKVV